MRKKRFKDLSPRGKAAVVLVTAASLPVIATAQRDIQRRPSAEIRGSRLVWRLVSLNSLGALGYLRWGRR